MKWTSVCENTCREEKIQELKFKLSIGSMLEKLKKTKLKRLSGTSKSWWSQECGFRALQERERLSIQRVPMNQSNWRLIKDHRSYVTLKNNIILGNTESIPY